MIVNGRDINPATGRLWEGESKPATEGYPLPEGKTCMDCRFFGFCRSISNVNDQKVCDAKSIVYWQQKRERGQSYYD